MPQPAYHCPRYLPELSLIRLFVRVFTHSFIHSDIHYMLARQQSGLKMPPSFSLFAARRRTRYVGSDGAHTHTHSYTHTHTYVCAAVTASQVVFTLSSSSAGIKNLFQPSTFTPTKCLNYNNNNNKRIKSVKHKKRHKKNNNNTKKQNQLN